MNRAIKLQADDKLSSATRPSNYLRTHLNQTTRFEF